MKFLHVSDLHIGRCMDGTAISLLPFQEQILDQILEQIRQQHPDALLITGDVLDKPHASDTEMDCVAQFLLAARRLTRVVMISGNHDGASRLGFLSELLQDGIHLVTRASQVGQAIEIPDAQGRVGALVYPIPYLYPYADRQVLSYWTDSNAKLHPDAYLAQLLEKDAAPGEDTKGTGSKNTETDLEAGETDLKAGAAPDQSFLPGKAAVLFAAALRRIGNDLEQRRSDLPVVGMAHDYLADFTPDSPPPAAGNLTAVPTDSLSTLGGSVRPGRGMDYLALGHIHRSYPVHHAQPAAWYAGSLLPYRCSDTNDTHSLLVEIDTQHHVAVTPLPFTLPYRVAQVTCTLEQLKTAGDTDFATLRDHFVTIKLTDPSLEPGAHQIARTVFPRLVRLEHTPAQSAPDVSVPRPEQLSPLQVARNFIENYAPSDEEISLLEELVSEALNQLDSEGGK